MVKCIFTKAKVIVNNTFNQDGMLKAIDPYGPPDPQNPKNVKMFILKCFNHTEVWKTIDCCKKECERYGFNPYYNLNIDISFPHSFATYVGLRNYYYDTLRCFTEDLELPLDYVADISVGL